MYVIETTKQSHFLRRDCFGKQRLAMTECLRLLLPISRYEASGQVVGIAITKKPLVIARSAERPRASLLRVEGESKHDEAISSSRGVEARRSPVFSIPLSWAGFWSRCTGSRIICISTVAGGAEQSGF
jgi:hypothetical protein